MTRRGWGSGESEFETANSFDAEEDEGPHAKETKTLTELSPTVRRLDLTQRPASSSTTATLEGSDMSGYGPPASIPTMTLRYIAIAVLICLAIAALVASSVLARQDAEHLTEMAPFLERSLDETYGPGIEVVVLDTEEGADLKRLLILSDGEATDCKISNLNDLTSDTADDAMLICP